MPTLPPPYSYNTYNGNSFHLLSGLARPFQLLPIIKSCYFLNPSFTLPPSCSILSTSCSRSRSCCRMYDTVLFSTMLSLLPCPSNPGTSSVSLSNPSRIAWRRFCSRGSVSAVATRKLNATGARGAQKGIVPATASASKNRQHSPEAIWFAFFSCSESLGLSSTLLVALPLAEASRPACDVFAGDDIAPALALVSTRWHACYSCAEDIPALPLYTSRNDAGCVRKPVIDCKPNSHI